MNIDPVDWTDRPPPTPLAHVWKCTDPITWVALLGPWAACWVHWNGKRTYPCYGERCPTAKHNKPAQWWAYAPAARAITELPNGAGKITGWERIVLPLNSDNAVFLRPKLGVYPGPMLQLLARAQRRGWTIGKIKAVRPDERLPAPFDVYPSLYRLWGIRPPDQVPDQVPDQGDDDQDER